MYIAGSVFYTNASHPFGGVVFAYTKTEIRMWTPKRGTGTSPANGMSFVLLLHCENMILYM